MRTFPQYLKNLLNFLNISWLFKLWENCYILLDCFGHNCLFQPVYVTAQSMFFIRNTGTNTDFQTARMRSFSARGICMTNLWRWCCGGLWASWASWQSCGGVRHVSAGHNAWAPPEWAPAMPPPSQGPPALTGLTTHKHAKLQLSTSSSWTASLYVVDRHIAWSMRKLHFCWG